MEGLRHTVGCIEGYDCDMVYMEGVRLRKCIQKDDDYCRVYGRGGRKGVCTGEEERVGGERATPIPPPPLPFFRRQCETKGTER